MKRGWRPGAIRLSAAGKVEVARTPTADELWDLLRQLMDWRGANSEAMPPELWVGLRQLIEWQVLQQPWTRRQVQLLRWHYVREGRDRLRKSWDEAYEYASACLSGSPAEAGPDAMKKAYDEVQKSSTERASSATDLRTLG